MKKNITRRNMLKTSTAAVGAVAGAGLLKGFPAIHAADAPVIRYLGTAVNMGDAVQKRLFDRARFQDYKGLLINKIFKSSWLPASYKDYKNSDLKFVTLEKEL